MGRVCVVGSTMMDIVVRTPRRPATGETVIGDSVTFFLGGKGFNQAIAAARNGATTTMIGRVGNDTFGNQFLTALTAAGIDTTHMGQDPHLGTGTGLPIVDARGDNAIVVVPQANLACTPAHIDAAATAIEEADVVLVQLELPIDTVQRTLQIARAANTTTICNPAPMHPDINRLAGLIDIITPNETEATAILAATSHNTPDHQTPDHQTPDHDIATAAAVAETLHTPAVVVTLGHRGALVWDNHTTTLLPAHPVDVTDTVGAGDALCGTLAANLAHGSSLLDATRRGVAAGSLAVTIPGAEPSMPTTTQIDALLTRAPVPSGGTP